MTCRTYSSRGSTLTGLPLNTGWLMHGMVSALSAPASLVRTLVTAYSAAYAWVIAVRSRPWFGSPGSSRSKPRKRLSRKAIPSKPLPPWAKPAWVRKPIIALFSCTRSGVCGPSAETAPLAPWAVIAPGPLVSSSPMSIWKSARD